MNAKNTNDRIAEEAKPLSIEAALAERDRITAEREKVHLASDNRVRRWKEITEEIRALEVADRAAINQAAVDGGDLPKSSADEIADLRADLERLDQMKKPANSELRRLAVEMEQLHVENYAAFAAHGEGLLNEAIAALPELGDTYVEVREKWAAGRAELDLLVRHWNANRRPDGPVVRTGKETRPRLVSVPECPLPDFDTLPTEAPAPTEYVQPDLMPVNSSAVIKR